MSDFSNFILSARVKTAQTRAYFSPTDDINIPRFTTNQARLRERPWVFNIDR